MTAMPLKATAALKQAMADHFAALERAVNARTAPVAWCTSVGPVEILRALGFEVYFPENHGALLGATRMAGETMARAHAIGYSPDICSYLTSDIGAYLMQTTPLQRHGMRSVPRADVLVYSTNQCREVRDWFEFYGREWGAPVIGVASNRAVGDVAEALVDGIARQMEDLVPVLEGVAGRKLDAVRLEESVARSKECSDLWGACLATAKVRPAPLTFFDGVIHMGPAVVLRGTDTACAYYRTLLEELSGRVRAGVGAVPGERTRLFWDGMPIWGRLRDLSSLFDGQRAGVVASTYCNSWVFGALDPRDPIRSMARASLELFIVRSEGVKEKALRRLANEFATDGIIFHDARTCPHNSNTRFGLPQRLREGHGIPVLVIDGDLNDPRCFSEEQARTSIEGFLEQLAEA